MPYGKGTYGSKRGRPPVKKKMTKGYARGGKISKMRMGGSKMTKGYARGGAIKKK